MITLTYGQASTIVRAMARLDGELESFEKQVLEELESLVEEAISDENQG